MPTLSYRQAGLVLRAGGTDASRQQIQDLQRDLRSLGYLRAGVDGKFGAGTAHAVKALQHDLLNNDGRSRSGDGQAPVRVVDFNRGRVTAETVEADQAFVECVSDMLDDPAFPALPFTADPAAENRKLVAQIQTMPSTDVPTLFLMAILKQESGLKHFHEPGPGDQDKFITVGLDAKKDQEHIVTSRGYGAGQYTLFHHPPRSDEINDFMLDIGKNLQKATREFDNKFQGFVNGPSNKADDRQGEIGSGPLRRCKFDSTDPRFMTDCRQCLLDAGFEDLRAGVTPLFQGSPKAYEPTGLRDKFTIYSGVPVRKAIGCDWPYAVRRYNGSGMDSYHYQAQVLLHLKAL